MSLRALRRTSFRQEQLHRVALRPPVGRGPRIGRWLTEDGVVPGRWPLAVCSAWLVVYTAAILLEPASSGERGGDPVWAVVLFTALVATLAVTFGGLARRQRLGLVAATGAAGLALVAAVMCPVSGHHGGVGAWWFLQMGGFTGLMALALAGLTRSRGRHIAG